LVFRLGRPALDEKREEAIRQARADGKGSGASPRDLGVGVRTVLWVTA